MWSAGLRRSRLARGFAASGGDVGVWLRKKGSCCEGVSFNWTEVAELVMVMVVVPEVVMDCRNGRSSRPMAGGECVGHQCPRRRGGRIRSNVTMLKEIRVSMN